jgi:hypothetical protein
MLLTLAMIGVALLALPAASSAEEIHLDKITDFEGLGGGATLSASGEPTITCGGPDIIAGTVAFGGTTGTIATNYTECHVTFIGMTLPCRTPGSVAENTIAASGTFHLITWKNGSGAVFPAMLVTPKTIEIVCGGITKLTVEGNGVIGTILSPACGAESKEVKLSFSAAGATQSHMEYTGVKYDLKAKTLDNVQLTAGLTTAATIVSSVAGKLTCT